MKRIFIGAAVLPVVLFTGCAGPSPRNAAPASKPTAQTTAQTAPQDATAIGKPVIAAGGTYTNVTPSELKTMLDNKDFPLINVHIPFEGNIANTDASIPYNEIDRNLDKLPADKNAQIVLYCRSGRMSTEAAHTLVNLGYTNLWHLDGGMIAWQQAGYTLE